MLCRLWPLLRPLRHPAGHVVASKPYGLPQSKTSIFIQLLPASPTHRMSVSFHFNLGLELQPFPLGSLRQSELRLPNFSRQRISRIETAPNNCFPICTNDGNPQHTGHSGNPIIDE